MLSENLEKLCASAPCMNFKTIPGSSSIHVVIFQPGETTIKTSNGLCISYKCKVQIGPCLLFQEYDEV